MEASQENNLKLCKRCGRFAAFYAKRSICKDCYKKEHSAWNKQYYLDNAQERKEYMAGYRSRNPEKVKAIVDSYYKSPKGKFKNYRKEARRRNIAWDLTFDQFMSFWQKPCYYTGKPIETIGLDRIDSDKGYAVDNVVPCLGKVNWAKNDMAQKEFLEMCVDIVKNLKLEK